MMGFEATVGQQESFEKANGRRYRVLVQRDLFGGLEIVKIWSTSGSRRGGYQVEPIQSFAECERRLEQIRAKRRQRGYLPT